MRKNQNIPPDMPPQEFDYADAAFILIVKPDGSWACEIADENITSLQISEYLLNIADQFESAEEEA